MRAQMFSGFTERHALASLSGIDAVAMINGLCNCCRIAAAIKYGLAMRAFGRAKVLF
jgi:hypothetical protein